MEIFLPNPKLFNPTTTLITLSFRPGSGSGMTAKPESSQNDPEDGYFDTIVIGGLLDAGSKPALDLIRGPA